MSTKQRWTLGVVCGATLLLLVNVTIVLVANPTIVEALDGSMSDQQWVISAYALMLAAMLLTAGALADDLGRQRVIVIGFAIFAVASLAATAAASPTQLIIARGVQGLGGALLLSSSMALLADSFQGPQRARALGVYGATIGAGTAIGPLLGGLLTQAGSWRLVFLVSVPLALVGLLAAKRHLDDLRPSTRRGVDWAGVATLTPALVLLELALIRGNAQGWGAPSTVGQIFGGVALLGAFVVAEARGTRPMADLSLLRLPAFAAVNVAAFAVSASVLAVLAYVVLFLLQIAEQSPIAAGAELLSYAAFSLATAPLAARLLTRFGARAMLGGGLLVAAAALLAMRAVSLDSGWAALLPGLVLAGASQGLLNPPIAQLTLAAVPANRSGMASGLNNTFRQLGVATGIAGLGAVFTAGLERRTGEGLDPAAALVESLDAMLAVAAGIAIVGALLTTWLLRPRRTQLQPTEAPRAQAATHAAA